MTVERAEFVRVSGSDAEVVDLTSAISAAATRAARALPGDRVDIVRYEALCTRLETLAHRRQSRVVACNSRSVSSSAPPFIDASHLDTLPPDIRDEVAAWIAAGDLAVELRRPFGPGETPTPSKVREPVATSEAWEAPNGAEGKRAVALRFCRQIDDVLSGRPDTPIMPSGVSNSVLTETLRSYVAQSGTPCNAPVVYRDGSKADPFPLRSVPLADRVDDGLRTLRFSLLSIRHTELDSVVDGAWLRNSQISRARPAGDTDRLVHHLTSTQLDVLCGAEPVHLYLFQTGLDSAIVGFYRALTERLRDDPGSVAVTPMYFRRPAPNRPRRTVAGYEQETFFAEGAPWAT